MAVCGEIGSTTSMKLNQSTDLDTNERIVVLSERKGNKLDNTGFEATGEEGTSEDLRDCTWIQLPQNEAAHTDWKLEASGKQDIISGDATVLGRTLQETDSYSGEAVSDKSPNKFCEESLPFDRKSDGLITEANSNMNPGGSVIKKYTSDEKCDKSNNWQNDIIGHSEVSGETENKVMVKGHQYCDSSDNSETKIADNCSAMLGLAPSESSALGGATNVPREDTVTLCGENDSNRDKLSQSESNLVGNTCLDSKIYSDVCKLDKEISSVLEKCEYLLQRPDLTAAANSGTKSDWNEQNFLENSSELSGRSSVNAQVSHINCQVLGSHQDKVPCLDLNQESVSVDTSVISIKSQSSQVSPYTMGGTNSIEKLEKIRARSKCQDGNDDLYVSRNCQDVDMETTPEKCQAFGSSRKERYAIKGTILPNMENSLFSDKDRSGSIQGNYEQSHQKPVGVSHEFNHLGKRRDCDCAISAITESRNPGFLTCSENTEKCKSYSSSDLCGHQVKSGTRKTSDSSEANHLNKEPSENLLSNQIQNVDHEESQDSTEAESHDDVVFRKGILRSPKLRSPKMSPMLRDRRFRHGTVGSVDSGSGSDQESVDSEDDDEDAGNVHQASKN